MGRMEWVFLFALSVAVVLEFFRAVEQWFANRERLVLNTEGGVTACCPMRALQNKNNRIVRGRVVVPETIVFSSKTPPVEGVWLSDKLDDLTTSVFSRDSSLFIPFFSERDIIFEDQAQIFLGEPMEARLKRAHRRRDIGQLLLRVVKSDQFLVTRFCFWVMVVLFAFLAPLKYFIGIEEQRKKAPATFITTDNKGVVVEHRDSFSVISQLPVGDQPFGDLQDIHKGEVAEIFPVSVGLGAVCIRDADQTRICGVAPDSLGLQVGDTVYLRRGTLRHKAGISTGAMEVLLIWAISEEEAQALVECGHSFVK